MAKKKKEDISTELVDLMMDEATNSSSKDEPKTVQLSEKTSTFHIEHGTNKAEHTAVKAEDNSDKTLAITNAKQTTSANIDDFFASSAPKQTPTGSPQTSKQFSKSKRDSQDVLLTAEASLVQSEQLRVAQERILELEDLVENLRTENEQLVAAGETFRNRSDNLESQVQQLQNQVREKSEILSEELILLKGSLTSKNEELTRARLKVEELEARLGTDLKRIRVRERELENRLEIAKLEHGALLKNKDEIILDLKRKTDQLNYELENFRHKTKDLNRTAEDGREKIRRTVKTLRLALSMLEGDDPEVKPLKKVD